MFKRIFKKATIEDLIDALDSNPLNEKNVQTLSQSINLNYINEKNQNLIHLMIPQNRVQSVKWLKTKGIDINMEDNEGNTPLSLAAQYGHVDMINLLLELGAKANHINKYKRIALQEAALNGQINAYCRLRKATTIANNIDRDGRNVLFDAVLSDNAAMVEEVLLDEHIELNLIDKEDKNIFHLDTPYQNSEIASILIKNDLDPTYKDDYGKNFLFYLLGGNETQITIFEKLIEKFPDLINDQDKNGNTLLHECVKILFNDEEMGDNAYICKIIHLLCKNDIDTSKLNHNGHNALTLTIEAERADILEFLLANNINPNILNKNQETPLAIVALKGNSYKDMIQLLINYGSNPNIPDSQGMTLVEKLIDIELFFSNHKKIPLELKQYISDTNDGYMNILKDVLQHTEVNLRQLNSQNQPYFFEAALYGNTAILKLLSYFGSDINQTGENGLNVLYYLLSEHETTTNDKKLKQYYESLRVLISLGANVNSRDDFGGIVLHKAILKNDLQTVKILVDHGSDINAIDNRGRNMVHNTIWSARTKILRLIFSKNKSLLNKEDKFGVLPIHYAAFLGYTELVLELINLGSHVNSHTQKATYILKFLERFHKNIASLEQKARNQADKSKINTLLSNMRREFNLQDIV